MRPKRLERRRGSRMAVGPPIAAGEVGPAFSPGWVEPRGLMGRRCQCER